MGSTIEPTELIPASGNQIRSARRLLQRKEREARREFLAEGPQAVREALRRPGTVRSLLVTAAGALAHPDLLSLAAAEQIPVAGIGEPALRELAGTVTPQGVVAVCRQVDVHLASVLARSPRLLVCTAQVRDPGNAGTVIRCADAFGADGVLVTAGSVDAYNPKTVRASVGSLFHLPLVVGADLANALTDCRRVGMQVLAADGTGDVELPDLTRSGELDLPTVWVFGNEAWGLPAEHRGLADRVVRVPIFGAAESLNLATAAAVCLYATATAQHSGKLPR